MSFSLRAFFVRHGRDIMKEVRIIGRMDRDETVIITRCRDMQGRKLKSGGIAAEETAAVSFYRAESGD